MNGPIGIFDSGIGGLTVAKELIKSLPREDLVYFGDTARVPYGTKSPRTVIKFSVENALFLLRFRVKLIVVACNTSSSYSLSVLKRNFKVPVIGVIGPGARKAVDATKSGRIGVIGTNATVNSGAYEREIKSINPCLKVFSRPCPLFVPLVEEGWLSGKVTREVARKYLKPLKDQGIDTLILGCTHYPLLKGVIRDVMGGGVELIDSAREVASYVKEVLLLREGLASRGNKGAQYKFYVSDESEKFSRTAAKFLNRRIKLVKKDITDV
jgi:glutamate racemase